MTQIIFYVFAVSAVSTALTVVYTRNPVKALLCLVLTFIAMAGEWILLHAEFLGLILIVVYVGAVMTLFLFVVMMLNIKNMKREKHFVRYIPLGLLLIILMTGIITLLVGPSHFGLNQIAAPIAKSSTYSNISALGITLYTQYVYPFEIAGALLLVAMVAAIALAFRGVQKRRVDVASKQIKVSAKSRIKLVSISNGKEINS